MPESTAVEFRTLRPGEFFTVPTVGIVWMKIYGGLFRSDGLEVNSVQMLGRNAAPGTLDSLTRDFMVQRIAVTFVTDEAVDDQHEAGTEIER